MFELYNEFIKFDVASKFYISLFVALVLFLYKTFLNMYYEHEKQSQSHKIKAGEVIAKLDAQLIIYLGSDKARADQDKLIEKLGEGYLYLNHKIRKKIRLYYANRSEAALLTLSKVISETIDSYGPPNEEKLIIEQIMSFVARLLKPLAPLIAVIITLLIAIIHYSQFVELDSVWDKITLTMKYGSFIFSIMITLGILNIIVESYKDLRNPGFRFWLLLFGVVVSPILILLLDQKLLYMSFFIQVILSLIIVLTISSERQRRDS
ncbi:hypothetical protein D3C81_1063730 [compost metagenome]